MNEAIGHGRPLVLTRRECQILAGIANEGTIQSIAKALGIRPGTVRTQRYRLSKKIGPRRAAQFTRLAIRLGLVPLRLPED
jgi:DNA-binding CsgD family transcriptional regulator